MITRQHVEIAVKWVTDRLRTPIHYHPLSGGRLFREHPPEDPYLCRDAVRGFEGALIALLMLQAAGRNYFQFRLRPADGPCTAGFSLQQLAEIFGLGDLYVRLGWDIEVYLISEGVTIRTGPETWRDLALGEAT